MAARECRSCIQGAQTTISFSWFFFSFLSLLVDCVENTVWHWYCALDRDELINVGTEWTGFLPCRLWPFHSGTLLKDYCKHSRPFHINEELHFMLSQKVFPLNWFFLALLPFCLTLLFACLCWLGILIQGQRKPFALLGHKKLVDHSFYKYN